MPRMSGLQGVIGKMSQCNPGQKTEILLWHAHPAWSPAKLSMIQHKLEWWLHTVVHRYNSAEAKVTRQTEWPYRSIEN